MKLKNFLIILAMILLVHVNSTYLRLNQAQAGQSGQAAQAQTSTGSNSAQVSNTVNTSSQNASEKQCKGNQVWNVLKNTCVDIKGKYFTGN